MVVNIRAHYARTVVLEGAYCSLPSPVAYYVAECGGEAPERECSVAVSFVLIRGKDGPRYRHQTGQRGPARRVVLIEGYVPFDKMAPTLAICAGGGYTWRGAGPRTTRMDSTSIALVSAGARVVRRHDDHPNVVRWSRCLGAWTYGADDNRVQSLVVASGPTPQPIRRWVEATPAQEAAYQAYLERMQAGFPMEPAA